MLDGSKDDLCAPGVLGLFVNKPCTWAAGKATMTVAPVINQCHWAIRNFHWHDSSDEWSYMTQGVMQIIANLLDISRWPTLGLCGEHHWCWRSLVLPLWMATCFRMRLRRRMQSCVDL